jgi:hypothetical protein
MKKAVRKTPTAFKGLSENGRFQDLSVDFFPMFLTLLAGDAKSGNWPDIQALGLDRFLAVLTEAEGPFIHSCEGLVDLREELTLAIPELEDEILIDFARGKVGLIRQVVLGEGDLLPDRILGLVKQPLLLLEKELPVFGQ